MATTLSWVVYADGGGTPSGAQVVAGQNSGGSAALASGSEPYTASGTYDEATAITSLSPSTAYRVAWVAYDTTTYSAVVVSSAITTSAPSSTPVSFSGTVPAQTGTVGSAYSVALSGYFAGSLTPFTYSVLSGALPAGVTLNTSTGALSGTPTTAASYSAVVRATDTGSNTAQTGTIAFTISAAALPSVTTSTVRRLMLRELLRGV